jgi:transposase InsO family protein
MEVFQAAISPRRPFMAQSSATAVAWAEGEAMRVVSNSLPSISRLGRHPIKTLSRDAKRRLGWFDYYRAHGGNASLTCRYFGISRTTFYRWRARYNPRDLTALEDHSCRPKRRRPKSWSTAEIEAVGRLRQEHPRWGKDKLAVLLLAEGMVISVSRVGRILSYLRGRGVIKEPMRGIKARQRRWKRPYGVRKPKDYPVQAPGDLVQLDTLEVRPEPGVALKQFTARDIISRWDCLELAREATASTSRRLLGPILERMPFPVRAIQVDGGSEFMAEFEEECKQRGIRLFVLPPRSPKLNGCVERANRTHTEEFYHFSTANPTVVELGAELRGWERVYNTVRPHQALGYLTPRQFLDRWNNQHPRKEEVSRT